MMLKLYFYFCFGTVQYSIALYCSAVVLGTKICHLDLFCNILLRICNELIHHKQNLGRDFKALMYDKLRLSMALKIKV